MGIAASHGLSKAEDRKVKPSVYNGKVIANGKRYKTVENLVEMVYCDLLNGVSRYQIIKKLREGLYDGQPKPYSDSHSRAYYSAALERIRGDADLKQEEARHVLLGRFETVYNDALLLGDKQSALRALENIGKIYRLYDNANTNVNINTDGANGVTINFGFDDGSKLQDKVDEEAEGGV